MIKKIKEGALHKQLGISVKKDIPSKTLNSILKNHKYKGKKATKLMLKRVQFAKNMRHKK